MKSDILKMLRDSGGRAFPATRCVPASGLRAWRSGSTSSKLQEQGYVIESGATGLPAAVLPGRPSTLGVPGPRGAHDLPGGSAFHHGHRQGHGPQGLPGFHRRDRRTARPRAAAGCAASGSSEAGGLYFTVVLRPRLPVPIEFAGELPGLHDARRASCATATAVDAGRQVAERHPGGGPQALRPALRDGERRASRSPSSTSGSGSTSTTIRPRLSRRPSRSRPLLGSEVSRRELLARFLDEFEARHRRRRWDGVIPDVESRIRSRSTGPCGS